MHVATISTFPKTTQCLKIIEKVSFNLASEASYVIWLRLVCSACHLSECVQFVIVLQRDRNMGRDKELNGNDKSKAENTKIAKFKWDILGDFQTMWTRQENVWCFNIL